MSLRGEVTWNANYYTDLAGQKFNRWSVIRRIGTADSGAALHECICDCGWIGWVTTYALKSGHSKSCGCLRYENPGRPKRTKAELNEKAGQ